jgi:nitrogen fixation NifU-like protein
MTTALDELYQATIVEHDRAPRHAAPLAHATHEATVDNPLCGDVVTVQARLEGEAISAIACTARGCALSRAAASIMATRVLAQDVAAARALAARFEHFVKSDADAAVPDELGELRAFAGVRKFRARRACALLAFRALLAALDLPR